MVGIPLSSLTEDLHKVDERFNSKPVLTIMNGMERLAKHTDVSGIWYEREFDFYEDNRKLPVGALADFSFDEICKMRYSTGSMGNQSLEDLFEHIPPYSIFSKIMSSMWRYGFTRATWNAVVDYYNSIRGFKFTDNSDFVVTLDHVPSIGAFSYAKYCTGLYLDGAFGYLVHYKGKHVMTIGFSLHGDESVLVSQIQLCKKTGNRFLYKLPENRVELVLGLFHKHFPGKKVYIVDGQSIVDKNLRGYRSSREKDIESLRNDEARSPANRFYTPEYTDKLRQNIAYLEMKIDKLEADEKRLVRFYAKTGKYKRMRKKVVKFGLTYREVQLRNTALWS